MFLALLAVASVCSIGAAFAQMHTCTHTPTCQKQRLVSPAADFRPGSGYSVTAASSIIALLPRATAGAGLIRLASAGSVVHNCCESTVQGAEHKCQRMGH